MGCQMATPSAIPTPTSTATPSATPSLVPSHTPTFTPSPTATITPTPEPTKEYPAGISRNLGLPGNDTYEFEPVEATRYLIKKKSGVRVAVVENQEWRKLDPENEADLEMMYGHLVPKGKYLVSFNYSIPMLAIPSFHEVHIIYLGEYEVTKVMYQGKEIELPLLLTGLRSADGKLHLVKVAVETPDLEPKRWYGTLWTYKGSSGRIIPRESEDLYEVLNMLQSGEVLSLNVVFSKGNAALPGLWKQEAIEDFKGTYGRGQMVWSNTGSVMLRHLYNKDPERITYEEAVAMEENGVWPDRVITIYSELGLILYMPKPN